MTTRHISGRSVGYSTLTMVTLLVSTLLSPSTDALTTITKWNTGYGVPSLLSTSSSSALRLLSHFIWLSCQCSAVSVKSWIYNCTQKWPRGAPALNVYFVLPTASFYGGEPDRMVRSDHLLDIRLFFASVIMLPCCLVAGPLLKSMLSMFQSICTKALCEPHAVIILLYLLYIIE